MLCYLIWSCTLWSNSYNQTNNS